MSTEKSFVGLGYTMCPACGEKSNDSCVLLDKRLKDTLEKETIIGPKLCDTHQKMVDDGYIVIVEVVKQGEQVFFCGDVMGVKREAAKHFLTIDVSKATVLHMEKEAYVSLKSALQKAIDASAEDSSAETAIDA